MDCINVEYYGMNTMYNLVLQQQQKARQMEEEILYGSKPAGTKRFAGNTPTKTPSKMRKVAHTK